MLQVKETSSAPAQSPFRNILRPLEFNRLHAPLTDSALKTRVTSPIQNAADIESSLNYGHLSTLRGS